MRNGRIIFSGTKFQAEITALYFGRLLNLRFRGDDQMVVEVRPEADKEAEDDDTLVRCKDSHTEWMQVMENLDKSGKPWKKMRELFNDQLSKIKDSRDGIMLILGSPRDWSIELRKVCDGTEGAKNGQECINVGITGMGGLGKIQLAVEYAHLHWGNYPHGVYWRNAAKPLLLELANLAETLGIAELMRVFKVQLYAALPGVQL